MIKLKAAEPVRLRQAYIPPHIEKDGIFQMDVDSNLWNAVAAAEDFPDNKVPDWLGSLEVRRGIRFFQESCSAEREEIRCTLESANLKQWCHEESRAIGFTLQHVKGQSCLLNLDHCYVYL
jgi:hypothetical protein